MSVSIAPAIGVDDISVVRLLFLEYQQALGIRLCFQSVKREPAQLPGNYLAPQGGLWLTPVDGDPVGCAGLRPVGHAHGETTRLCVRPALPGTVFMEQSLTCAAGVL